MITDFERKIAETIKDETIEHVLIIKDFEITYRNYGNHKEVDCPICPELFETCVMIHNHPIFKWKELKLDYEKGASIDDFEIAKNNNVSKFILVENYGNYSQIIEYKINNENG